MAWRLHFYGIDRQPYLSSINTRVIHIDRNFAISFDDEYCVVDPIIVCILGDEACHLAEVCSLAKHQGKSSSNQGDRVEVCKVPSRFAKESRDTKQGIWLLRLECESK